MNPRICDGERERRVPLFVAAIVSELPTEERMLRAKFVAAYEAYEAQTGRLLPRIWRRRRAT
jgi:protein-S-isoprenylcysteine O-methyltransferase Ste14